jgi:hypothetical protein
MKILKKHVMQTYTSVIAGRKVTVAAPAEVKESSARLKVQYAKALEILKNS